MDKPSELPHWITRPLASDNVVLTEADRAPLMSEPPLVRELRVAIAALQEKTAAQARQIEELRGAVVALMEPGTPRVLRTPGGIIVLDKK